ncbi:MAG: translesion error-prone DNA polymerase V autoproteolytic subunit [Ktedonobacteraceae bacterium]
MNYRPLPLFGSHVSCGFPSPADDYIETKLDLNELVIAHPEATFYVRVSGDSMMNAAICDGDIVVIDRARKAEQNSIVLALVNEEFTVKRLRKQGTTILLFPENPAYEPIRITDEMDFQLWGVVTYCIHRL